MYLVLHMRAYICMHAYASAKCHASPEGENSFIYCFYSRQINIRLKCRKLKILRSHAVIVTVTAAVRGMHVCVP